MNITCFDCLIGLQVFGDRLDDLARNFGQSFASTLSTLGSIYESSMGDEGNSLNTMKMEFPTRKLTREKGDFSSDSVIGDDKKERVLSEEIIDQTMQRGRGEFSNGFNQSWHYSA